MTFKCCPKVSIRVLLTLWIIAKKLKYLKISPKICILKGENPNYPSVISNFEIMLGGEILLQIMEPDIFKEIYILEQGGCHKTQVRSKNRNEWSRGNILHQLPSEGLRDTNLIPQNVSLIS